MNVEDTGIAMIIHSRPLPHSNKATVVTTPLTPAVVEATNMTVRFTGTTVTMAAALGVDTMDEEHPSQVHTTVTTLNPQIDSQIVSV